MKYEYDVINSNKYFNLISKAKLSDQEQQDVQKFQELMTNANKYKDYLTGTLKQNKDSYERGINQLAVLESSNPNIRLSDYQKHALDAYAKQNSYNDEIRDKKIRRLEKNNQSLGYANAFILVLTVLATGITTGIVLFMMTNK